MLNTTPARFVDMYDLEDFAKANLPSFGANSILTILDPNGCIANDSVQCFYYGDYDPEVEDPEEVYSIHMTAESCQQYAVRRELGLLLQKEFPEEDCIYVSCNW